MQQDIIDSIRPIIPAIELNVAALLWALFSPGKVLYRDLPVFLFTFTTVSANINVSFTCWQYLQRPLLSKHILLSVAFLGFYQYTYQHLLCHEMECSGLHGTTLYVWYRRDVLYFSIDSWWNNSRVVRTKNYYCQR